MLSRMNSGRLRAAGVRGRDNEFPSSRAKDHALITTTIKSQETQNFDFGQFGGQETLPERPSTSSGPSSSSQPIRRNASKRETKDDLYFNPLQVHGRDTKFYNFHFPGSLPTPGHSPKELSLPPQNSSMAISPPSQPPTPDSMNANSNYATMPVPHTEIGMALGSPSQQPVDWPPMPHNDMSITMTPEMANEAVPSTVAPPAKQKGSRWKVFGGLFGGKKQPEAQQPFYQVQPLESPQHKAVVETEISARGSGSNDSGELSANAEESKMRSRGRSFSTRKSKSTVKRSNTMPSAPSNSKTSVPTTPEVKLDGVPLGINHQLLDVNIPSIQMERYSVMFGSVLQKPTNNTSTLLARRQATLDNLKTAKEALAAKEREIQENEKRLQLQGRRATSPGFPKSPGFSLFPSTPSRPTHSESSPTRSLPKTPGRLQRSNTSPAALSPSRPSFTQGPDNNAHSDRVPLPAAQKSRPSLDNGSPAVPPVVNKVQKGSVAAARAAAMLKQKALQQRNWSPDESHLALSSPDSANIEYTHSPGPVVAAHDPVPLKPILVEPAKGIVNKSENAAKPPTISSISSSTSGLSGSTASSKSVSFDLKEQPLEPASQPKSVGSAQPRSRIPVSASKAQVQSSDKTLSKSTADDDESKLKAAADVSIARQISVSRQQRQLLAPINMNKKIPNQNLNKGYAASPVAHKSPLGAVATAVSEEREREGKGVKKNPTPILVQKERIVDVVKPATPTLVIMPGPKDDHSVKAWDGNTASPVVHPGTPVSIGASISERRRGKEMGEIKVGLEVKRGRTGSDRTKEQTKELQQRKSERVLVERVGVTSN